MGLGVPNPLVRIRLPGTNQIRRRFRCRWILHLNQNVQGESSMYRLLSCTAVVVCMALTPALAADDSSQAGAPDQSTGAKEQSSAPPASGAASDTKPMGEMKPSSGDAWTPPRAPRSKARLLLAHLHRILLSPIPPWELRRNKQRTIDLRLKGDGARCRPKPTRKARNETKPPQRKLCGGYSEIVGGNEWKRGSPYMDFWRF